MAKLRAMRVASNRVQRAAYKEYLAAYKANESLHKITSAPTRTLCSELRKRVNRCADEAKAYEVRLLDALPTS